MKAHLRDVFGVYAVDRVSHILPGGGGLIGHIGNKFAASTVYIYLDIYVYMCVYICIYMCIFMYACTEMHQYSAYF